MPNEFQAASIYYTQGKQQRQAVSRSTGRSKRTFRARGGLDLRYEAGKFGGDTARKLGSQTEVRQVSK